MIVDDHELVLMGISLLLANTPMIKIVGKAHNGQEAIALAEHLNPNVILMDVNMPGMNGMMASKKILKKNKNQKIILLSSLEKWTVVEKAKVMGIKGYVIKGSDPLKVIEAIHEVYDEKNPFIYKGPHLLIPRILNKSPFNELSYKELEVLDLILKGYSVKAMTKILDLEERTVRFRRANIREKLKLKNDLELIELAVEAGFYQDI